MSVSYCQKQDKSTNINMGAEYSVGISKENPESFPGIVGRRSEGSTQRFVLERKSMCSLFVSFVA